jgi:outer membrane immunogenic protein
MFLKRYRRFIAAALLSAMIPGAEAVAKDWSGPYAGFNIGVHENEKLPADGAIFGNFTNPDFSNPISFSSGLQLGYNRQTGSIVLGGEVDASWLSGKDTISEFFFVPGILLFQTSGIRKQDWLTTFRLRLGYAPTDDVLFYATGGVAAGRVNTSVNLSQDTLFVPLLFQEAGTLNKVMFGPAFGAGVEFRLFGNASMKAEYIRYDLGSASIPLIVVGGGSGDTYSFNNKGNIFRLGVNFNLDQ